jgi:hypothetical protein
VQPRILKGSFTRSSLTCAVTLQKSILHLLLVAVVLIATLPRSPGFAADEDWQQDWMVLTLASNGVWGAASDSIIDRAIAFAIRDCKAKAKGFNDCGGRFTTIRAGWSVAEQCGKDTIIVAEKQLPDAERAALNREIELRTVYRRTMPTCVRVVTISPGGVVEAPPVDVAERGQPLHDDDQRR